MLGIVEKLDIIIMSSFDNDETSFDDIARLIRACRMYSLQFRIYVGQYEISFINWNIMKRTA